MIKFAAGFFCGIVIATIGFAGVVKMADDGVKTTQAVVKEVAKAK